MSQRAPYVHASPVHTTVSSFPAPLDFPDPDSPSKRLESKHRANQLERQNQQHPPQNGDAEASSSAFKPLSGAVLSNATSEPTASVGSKLRRNSLTEKKRDKEDDNATGEREHKAKPRSRRLTAILGRRRRWQRIALFLLFLFTIYFLFLRPRRTSQPKINVKHKARPLPKAGTTTDRQKAKAAKAAKPLYQRTVEGVRAPLPASVVLQSRLEHTVREGLLEVDMDSRVHPIYQLIRDAREEWDEKVQRQSRSLEQAVKEYMRRNAGRKPPKGFDRWWEYVV